MFQGEPQSNIAVLKGQAHGEICPTIDQFIVFVTDRPACISKAGKPTMIVEGIPGIAAVGQASDPVWNGEYGDLPARQFFQSPGRVVRVALVTFGVLDDHECRVAQEFDGTLVQRRAQANIGDVAGLSPVQ